MFLFIDTGVCPAVMELSSDCSFTERAGILIDDDARNLCNRHEMCYRCVSLFNPVLLIKTIY